MCSWSRSCSVTPPTDPRTLERREQARARTARQRRIALAAVAVAAAGIGVWLGSRGSDDRVSEPQASRAAPPSCPAQIASNPRMLAGQMLMVRFDGTATPELVRAARRGEIGGVIAFPPTGSPAGTIRAAIARLQRAARDGGNALLLVATDQEGGEVKRLPGPPDRSPAELAVAGARAAASEGRATGRYLRGLGINVDLAPVLDLGLPGSFIASRTFGPDPASVATLGVAFASGLEETGVAATAKHFPGLGLATVNTDLEPVGIEASRRDLSPGLEPFRAAVSHGVSLVMVANALYPIYGGDTPASLATRITTGLLRNRLGFDGVVITDDLLAGAISGAGYTPGEAAVGAARAGADLLLFARVPAPEALPALVAALRSGSLSGQTLRDSCVRNLALREALSRGSP
jgi:beta-N-acetylhexosaminidase